MPGRGKRAAEAPGNGAEGSSVGGAPAPRGLATTSPARTEPAAPAPPAAPGALAPHPLARGVWTLAGLVLVGLGSLGLVLPVLPTTVFFIGAAACFARSSPRLERWVLGLPHVGPLVRDYRSGLGMPRRAKALAIGAIVAAVTLSAVALPSWPARAGAAALALLGVWYVAARVPTRERVLAERGG
jgi:uncharacterized membrane protein YbaN (DUF454 family)